MALQTTSDIAFDKDAWEFAAHFPFREQVFFDSLCEVKPAETSTPGSTVYFTFVEDLPEETTPLVEDEDVTPQTFGDSSISLTTEEFGAAVTTTKFLRVHSFIPFNPIVARAIGYQAGRSQDSLAREAFISGTNVLYEGEATQRSEVKTTDVLTSSMLRRVRARLLNANVPMFGNFYVCILNPDTSVDLREETGVLGWRNPNEYGASQERIWNGEIGAYEGFRFIEAPRAPKDEEAGDNDADVYLTLCIGRQAVAKAYAPAVGPRPTIVDGPITDTLRRFVPMGWYWIGAYGVFRNESLIRIEHGSSV